MLIHNMGKTDDGNALVVGVLCYGYVCSAWCRLWALVALLLAICSLHYVLLPFLFADLCCVPRLLPLVLPLLLLLLPS